MRAEIDPVTFEMLNMEAEYPWPENGRVDWASQCAGCGAAVVVMAGLIMCATCACAWTVQEYEVVVRQRYALRPALWGAQ